MKFNVSKLFMLLVWTTINPLAFAKSSPKEAMPSPQELLSVADRARGGVQGGLAWTAKLESTEDGDTSTTVYLVRTKGNFAHAEVVEPARKKGEVLLFNDRSIWFYKPGLQRPVAMSARQRLSGQTANGDIANTNYARDYEGKITGSEKVSGEDCWVLELKAKNQQTTYDQIRYWIAKKDRLGKKAEFLSLQGKPMKVATFKYENDITVQRDKTPFVSEMNITDVQNPENRSVLTYVNPKVDQSPDHLFNVNNLLR